MKRPTSKWTMCSLMIAAYMWTSANLSQRSNGKEKVVAVILNIGAVGQKPCSSKTVTFQANGKNGSSIII